MSESHAGAQLNFHLQPQNPHALDYFVTHSGVVEVVQALEEGIAALGLCYPGTAQGEPKTRGAFPADREAGRAGAA